MNEVTRPKAERAETGAGVIPVVDPSTGDLIAEIEDGGAQAVDEAVLRARATFDSGVWRNKPGSEQARIMWRFAELLEEAADELGEIDSLNTGMRPLHARNLVGVAAEGVRYCAGWTTKIHGQSMDLRVGGGISGLPGEYHAYTVKEPVGVAGLITPWNGPLYCAVMKIAPALAAGCSAVLKPAEEAPLFTPALERIMLSAGIPEGVINIVNGRGHTTGAAIAAHPGIDKIAFTGSTETGKLVVQAATGNLKKVMLELGGKSPVLVFADADLEKAALGAAMGIFINSGQGCICGSRIYVQRSVYDEFLDRLAKAARNIRVGGSRDENVDIGPLISERQMKRVLGFIEEGRAEGVEVVTGGNRIDRKGFFVEPTVLAGVSDDMRLMREEIFGPVVGVVPFDDEREALAAANGSDFGLAAAIWTKDVGRAHRMAKAIQAGTVWVNCQLVLNPSMPFGGYKQSGWGRERSWEGVDSFLQTKSVLTNLQI